MGEQKYTEKDAAKDTGSSVSEVSATWHQARDDAERSGHLEERSVEKVSDSEHGPALYEAIKSLGEDANKKKG